MRRRNAKLSRFLSIGGVSILLVGTLGACSSSSTVEADPDCTPAHEFETVEPGMLTVATYDYPPYTLIEGDDAITGLEGDLLTEFAARQCLELNVQSSGGAGAVIPSVETGRADLGAGDWYRTEDRAEVVRMSAPTVLDVAAAVSMTGISSDDLDQGYKVGSVSGSLWDQSLQSWLGDDFTIYQDPESIYSDLNAGRLDVIIVSAAAAITRFEDNPIDGAEITTVEPNDNVPEFERPGQVNFPSSLENEGFGDALDAVIQDMHDDGTISDIVEKYGLDPQVADVGEAYNL